MATRINLSKRVIEGLRTPDKRITFHDGRVRGLSLTVQVSGHKSWGWFKKAGGKLYWKSLGPFPDLDVEAARSAAERWNTLAAQWKASGFADPCPLEKRDSTPDITLDQLVEHYIERHMNVTAAHPARDAKLLRDRIERYMHSFRSRRLSDIQHDDVRRLHLDLGSTRRAAANECVKWLRVLFNFALREKLWKGESPAEGFKLFPFTKRDRYLTREEIGALLPAMDRSPSRDVVDAIHLLLHTGARKQDVLGMAWADISFDEKEWRVPKPKGGIAYRVPLIPLALEVLRRVPRYSGDRARWVFPSYGGSGHLIDIQKAWTKILKDAGLFYKDDPERRPCIHDLRRTNASHQARLGTSLLVIAKGLGHKSTKATEIYSRLSNEPARDAMTAASEYMVSGTEESK
jgi:integrase